MESLICTVYNEEKSIQDLLESILHQSQLPPEVIIVDAMSTDSTWNILKNYKKAFGQMKIAYRLLQKAGNRSTCRNYAISQARYNHILVTDAGCILDKDWVRNITKPFKKNPAVDVVSGFYIPAYPPSRNAAETVFQHCLAAYTSVMHDKFERLTAEEFLPSSRSIAFKKSAWADVKGYPENLDTAEDLMFARSLRETGMKFELSRNAIVYWPQKKSLSSAFVQFFRYARGDGQALHFRPQTPLIFARYAIGLALLISAIIYQSPLLVFSIIALLCAYALWSVRKNYGYVRSLKAIFLLPTLQVVSDIATLTGMSVGMFQHPVFSNVIIQLIGRGFTAGIGFLTTFLLARYLGPQEFGTFSFIFAISTAVFMFADLGLDAYITRETAQKVEKKALGAIFSLRVYIAGALSMLLVGTLLFSGYSADIKRGILIASVSSIALLLSNTLWSVLKGQLKYKIVVAAQVLTALIILSLFWFGLLQKRTLNYFLIIHAVGYLSGLLFSSACWDRPYSQIKLVSKQLGSLLIRFWPFIGIYLFATAYFKIDMLLLGFFFSPQHSPAVGYYSLAYKPFEIAIVIGGYFTQTLLPYFTSSKNQLQQKSRNVFRNVTFFIALCAFVGLYILAPLYIQIIGGSEYMSALAPLRILALAAAVTVLSGYYASSLLADHKEKAILWVSIVAFCVNIAVNSVLIPQYSYIAASWTTVLTQCIVLVGYIVINARNNAQAN